jgi:hypothetical protein
MLAVCTFIYAAQGLLALQAERKARAAYIYPFQRKGLIDA